MKIFDTFELPVMADRDILSANHVGLLMAESTGGNKNQ
jgi:hypothetical protein